MSDVTPASKSETTEVAADETVEPAGVVDDTETETATDLEPDVAPSVLESEPDAPAEAATGEVPELVEPAAPPVAAVDHANASTSVADPVVEPEAVPVETSAVDPVVAATPVVASPASQQVVYMAPPIPPKRRGNRGVGVLLSIVGAILFAAVYGVVSAVIIDFQSRDFFGPQFVSFLGSAFFWIPVVVFLVGLVLLVLLLNRAGWWAHVLGSLVLAFVVYFGMIGLLLFVGNTLHESPTSVTFAALATNPWVIAAAVVTREVSIWIGLAIAARGRRVRARNIETRAAFDREQESRRAEYSGAAPAA
jgi:hypothetical protein